jgi:phage host-nuclease inhibitor protein Gam
MAIKIMLTDPFPDLGELKKIPEVEKEPFQVENKEQAEWCLRQISRLQREQEEVKSVAQAEIEKIATWEKERTQALQRSIDFFENLLIDYHRRILQEDPKAKTIKLPSGNLEARKAQPEFQRDVETMLPWVEQNRPEYIVVKKDINWSGLKKILKYRNGTGIDPDTGEVVPGLKVIERGMTFRVKTL